MGHLGRKRGNLGRGFYLGHRLLYRHRRRSCQLDHASGGLEHLAIVSLEPQDRAWLHARIAQRFDAMLAHGFVDEVIALLRHVMIDMRQERLLRFAVAGVADDSLQQIQTRGRAAVEQLVAAAHRDGSLYPDITANDVVLLLSTAPADAMSAVEQARWLTLARRALTPDPAADRS